jgi:hypothetical protein
MEVPSIPSIPLRASPGPFRGPLLDAARFWEPRRLIYNAVLTAVVVYWIVSTWPHFRPALKLVNLLRLGILALLANICYCAAYAVDLPLQRSKPGLGWQRWRRFLWTLGTIFAVLLEWYWIGDEIYPDFS